MCSYCILHSGMCRNKVIVCEEVTVLALLQVLLNNMMCSLNMLSMTGRYLSLLTKLRQFLKAVIQEMNYKFILPYFFHFYWRYKSV